MNQLTLLAPLPAPRDPDDPRLSPGDAARALPGTPAMAGARTAAAVVDEYTREQIAENDENEEPTFMVDVAPPGTIVTYQGEIVRRRPHATIGLPWKGKSGARYSHDEIRAYVSQGAEVAYCQTCGHGQPCSTHDDYATSRGPNR